ncbi:MAG TPA: DEAD/DEAH box helicase, partial [Longimicrobiaceae bacterium]|nr:DEAD/DEAH box helicase [Longimicrobiaceae bacterium]
MAGFEDLGLREPLLMALEEEGIEHPTALQQAVIPVLRREGNLVARAGSGSGKTAAYALGVLDRIEPRAASEEEGEDEGAEKAAGPRVLVLVPTEEVVEFTALALVPYAHAVELTVTAAGPGWGIAAGEADVLVATPQQVLEAVRTSGIKLDGVEAVVIDGASDIEGVGGWEALETLFDNVPRTAQRVVLSSTMTPGVQDLADRRVKRAIRYPTQPALAPTVAPQTTGVVGYVPVAERDKVDVVARLLGGDRGEEAAPVLVCRTDERASQVAEALALRGFMVGEAGDPDAHVALVGSGEALQALAGEAGHVAGTVISFDVPADEQAFRARHGGDITGFVLVEPRELPHLRDVAARAGLEARPAGVTGEERPGTGELRAFRQEVRRALREEDLGAVMLVLEPLFEDHTPAEVAAALAALLRRKRAAEPAPAPSSSTAATASTPASVAAA